MDLIILQEIKDILQIFTKDDREIKDLIKIVLESNWDPKDPKELRSVKESIKEVQRTLTFLSFVLDKYGKEGALDLVEDEIVQLYKNFCVKDGHSINGFLLEQKKKLESFGFQQEKDNSQRTTIPTTV